MEENNVQSEAVQDTTPAADENETQQAEADAQNADTAPEGQQSGEEDAAARVAEATTGEAATDDVNAAEPPSFLTVQYNHESRGLSRDEAVSLAQKGLHYDTLHGKLDYVASLQGIDVNTFVERLVKAPEEAHRKHLEELYGEDSSDVEIGMNIFREKQSADYKKIIADREAAAKNREAEEHQSTLSRLAEEYRELKAEIADAPEYSALPDEVIREAASGKRDLYSAYLRHLHKESRKVNAAKQTAATAEAAAAGSMDSDSENVSSAEQQFLAGLWGR